MVGDNTSPDSLFIFRNIFCWYWLLNFARIPISDSITANITCHYGTGSNYDIASNVNSRKITEFPPIHTLPPIRMGKAYSYPWLRNSV